MDRVHEDHKIENMQMASATLSIGILLLCFAGISGLFFFQTLRSGTMMWRDFFFIEAGLGVVLTGIGTLGRRHNS